MKNTLSLFTSIFLKTHQNFNIFNGMKKVLLFGAGRSATALIEYLTALVRKGGVALTIVDAASTSNATQENITYLQADIFKEQERQKLIEASDIVLSLLPPALHLLPAQDCVRYGKHFITASYNNPEIQALDKEAKNAGIVLLMECGLDPGIDHMSALKELDDIRQQGGDIRVFKSYTGGLVAPESDNNPWHYKITWNPRNVVLAGQGVAHYLEDNQQKYIPYHRLFSTTELLEVHGHGFFEGYANRDSLKYQTTYNLTEIDTFLRGTLRRPGFCASWNLLVQLGLTDDSFRLQRSDEMTWKEFTTSFINLSKDEKINHRLAKLIHKGPGAQEIRNLKWLGLLDEQKTMIPDATPAQLLQARLEQKWAMQPGDKDMIVMQHRIEYLSGEGKRRRRIASMVQKGIANGATAMAQTVGLPLGIATRLLLEDKVKITGVQIPATAAWYVPLLEELVQHGIKFQTSDTIMKE
jgi:saccharopine dehydrogenase-like NADP-dependent oxidoreductase